MERKHTRAISVKGKLISALCMLLVAVIMVVSSTYAWFTLSTAPEVTGISTAVGSNGALEIRLNRSGYDSDTGANADGTIDRNATWGNIVNLQPENGATYGLENITLLPSTMVVNGNIYGGLKYPTYGDDGRPNADSNGNVVADGGTSTGVYEANAFNTDADATGVRAVGVASGLSPRQLAYRNSKQAANTAKILAKNAAQASLVNNGSTLANMVVRKATVTDATFTAAEVSALRNIVDAFGYNYSVGEETYEQAGLLDYLEDAYIAQFLALISSQNTETGIDGENAATIADTVYNYFAEEITSLDKLVTLDGDTYTFATFTIEDAADFDGIPDNDATQALLDGIKKYFYTKNKVEQADTALRALATKDSYVWDDIDGVVDYLVDADAIKVNKKTPSEIIADPNSLANQVLQGMGINVTMANGSGIYTDVAEQCGDYTASIKLTIVYNSLTVENADAKMSTTTIGDDDGQIELEHITAIQNFVEAAGMPENTGSAESSMTDFYGYIIDLAFRTNAASSNLLLQVEGTDRIYKDNQNELTQGGGSSMTFKSTAAGFGDEQVKRLMSAIRIVFFATDSNSPTGSVIYAYARLDTGNATIDSDGVTAKMFICDETGNPLTENKIVALTQNAELKVSTLVYLEGDPDKGGVDNTYVAATSEQSLVGSMNLQFASSATLVPMEYGDLHIQGSDSN